MDWYVYIAQTKALKYYVGISQNPIKRLFRHNSMRGSRFAQQNGPMELVWVSCPYSSKSEARKREVQLKKWSRQKKENLILGVWK